MTRSESGETVELLPCPFCGGKAERRDFLGLMVSHQTDCLLNFPVEQEAIYAAWNTRATLTPTMEAAPVERVREALGAPQDWAAQLAKLQSWTGSAFLAGETDDSDGETKTELYGFLCGLIGYLMAGEDASRAALSSPPEGPGKPYQSAADCPLGNAHGIASTHGGADGQRLCDFCGLPVSEGPDKEGV